MPCRGACEPCPGAGPRVTAASNLGGARPPRHKRPATCATSVAFDLALRSGVRGSFAQRYGCYFSLHALALWTRPPQGRQAGQTATGDLALSWKGTRTETECHDCAISVWHSGRVQGPRRMGPGSISASVLRPCGCRRRPAGRSDRPICSSCCAAAAVAWERRGERTGTERKRIESFMR